MLSEKSKVINEEHGTDNDLAIIFEDLITKKKITEIDLEKDVELEGQPKKRIKTQIWLF